MAEFEIGGMNYRTSKMGLLDAMQVARKIAPVYGRIMLVRSELAPLLEGIMADRAALEGTEPEAGTKMTGDLFQKVLGSADRLIMPILDELARASREDVDSVMALSLGVCMRQQQTGWAPVWNVQARGPQFQDIDLPIAIRLVWAVVSEQLAGFFPAPASNSN